MRNIVIAGNWKMHHGPGETERFFQSIVDQGPEISERVDAIVCPPFVSIPAATLFQDRLPAVKLGAQDVYHEARGAYTGEVSTGMLRELGCSYVIVGHSERRELFGETDAWIHKKARRCLDEGLTPIICVGEKLDNRQKNQHLDVVKQQFEGVMGDLDEQQAGQVVVAYEPVWAIGTGETATPDKAQEMHAHIRDMMAGRYSSAIADDLHILYGGSVKPENASELLQQPDVDGGLVGGASLKPDAFVELLKSAEEQLS